jgi:hypothetical protein
MTNNNEKHEKLAAKLMKAEGLAKATLSAIEDAQVDLNEIQNGGTDGHDNEKGQET